MLNPQVNAGGHDVTLPPDVSVSSACVRSVTVGSDSSRGVCTDLGLSVVAAAAPVRMFVSFHFNGAQHRCRSAAHSSKQLHAMRGNTQVSHRCPQLAASHGSGVSGVSWLSTNGTDTYWGSSSDCDRRTVSV